MEYMTKSMSGYETKETSLYSTEGVFQVNLPVFDNEISLNAGGLEQTVFMPDQKDDSQPQQKPDCDGCKCPNKSGQDKGDGCDGGGKKDCDPKKDCDKK